MDLAQYIRDIPDFPKPGILFKDITPLLAEPRRLPGRRSTACASIIAAGRSTPSPPPRRAASCSPPRWPCACRSRSFRCASRASCRTGRTPAIRPGVRQRRAARAHRRRRRRAPGCCWSTTCWPPAARMQAGCQLIEKAGGKVVGCAFLVELDVPQRPRAAEAARGVQLDPVLNAEPTSAAHDSSVFAHRDSIGSTMNIDFDKAGGLVPAIAQDADTGAGADAGLDEPRGLRGDAAHRPGRATSAAAATSSGARARRAATSRKCSEVFVDCDADTILLKVQPDRRRRLPRRLRELLLPPGRGRRPEGRRRAAFSIRSRCTRNERTRSSNSASPPAACKRRPASCSARPATRSPSPAAAIIRPSTTRRSTAR